jgi:hypothetical protein
MSARIRPRPQHAEQIRKLASMSLVHSYLGRIGTTPTLRHLGHEIYLAIRKACHQFLCWHSLSRKINQGKPLRVPTDELVLRFSWYHLPFIDRRILRRDFTEGQSYRSPNCDCGHVRTPPSGRKRSHGHGDDRRTERQRSFAGMTPFSVGLYQINVQVPNPANGTYPLVISQGGVQNSNKYQVAVSN